MRQVSGEISSATLAGLRMRCSPVRDGSFPEEAASAWTTAWEADETATVFQHPDWSRACLPGLSGESLVLADERTGLGVRVEDAVLRFLPDPSVSDLAGPVGGGSRDDAAAALMECLVSLDWERADLDGLSVEGGWVEPMTQAAKALGLGVAAREVATSPAIPLEGDFEAYLAALESKQRHEVRRKGRRLDREIGAWTTRLTGAATLSEDLEGFAALHRRASGEKGAFMTPQHEALFGRVAAMALEHGWLRLSWIEGPDGASLAAVFSFEVRGRWLVWNSAFDPDLRNLSVGMVAMAEQIRLACEAGCHTFDLLRGDEEYKYRLGAKDVPVFALTLDRGGA